MEYMEIRSVSRGLVTDVNPEISPPDFSRDLVNLLPDSGRALIHPRLIDALTALDIDVTGGAVYDAGDFYDTADKWRPWVSCKSVVSTVLGNRIHVLNDAGTDWDVYGPYTPEYRYTYSYAGYVVFHDGSDYSNDLIYGNFPDQTLYNGALSVAGGNEVRQLKIESPLVLDGTGNPVSARQINVSVSQSTSTDGYFSENDIVELAFSLKYMREEYSYLSIGATSYTISADNTLLSITLRVHDDIAAGSTTHKWPVTHIVVWARINNSDWRRWGEIDLNSGVIDDTGTQRNWSHSSPNASITFTMNGSPLVDNYEVITGYRSDDVNYCDSTPAFVGSEKSPSVVWKAAIPFRNRILYGNCTVDGEEKNDRIYVSLVGKPHVVPTWAYFDLGTDDGDQIVTLRAYGNVLYVIKSRHIYVIDASSIDPSGWRVVNVLTGTNVTSKWQALVVSRQLYIADSNGLYRVTPEGVFKISKAYQTAWQSIPSQVLGFYRGRYELMALNTDSVVSGFNIALDDRNGRIQYSATKLNNLASNWSFDNFYPISGSNSDTEFYMFCKYTAGSDEYVTMKKTSYTAGWTIPLTLKTPDMDIGPVYIRRVRLIGNNLEAGSVKLLDESETNSIEKSVSDGDSVVTLRGGLRIYDRFHITYSSSAASVSSDFRIEKIEIYYDRLPLSRWR